MNQRNAAIRLSLMIIMATLTTVSTLFITIPIPLAGYFNLGDVMIFISALTFGPIIGGFAGGLGSAIADMLVWPVYAIPTLIIKGLEGLLAGLLTNKRHIYRDVLAVIIAGVEMVLGYFIVDWLILKIGWAPALGAIPFNVMQIILGGVIGIPIAYVLRRRLPKNLTT